MQIKSSKTHKHFFLIAGAMVIVAIGLFFFNITSTPEKNDDNEMVTVTIPDGLRKEHTADIPGLGTFHDSPTQNGLKSYLSEGLDISFNYPENYRLFEGQGQGSFEYYVITISPEPYISEILASDADTEWPASIQLMFYREPNLSIPLEEWIRTKHQSNFDVSDPAQKGILTPTTVASLLALQYEVIGLYDFEYTAFLHGEWVVLAANPGIGEYIDQDFQTVLSSIELGS